MNETSAQPDVTGVIDEVLDRFTTQDGVITSDVRAALHQACETHHGPRARDDEAVSKATTEYGVQYRTAVHPDWQMYCSYTTRGRAECVLNTQAQRRPSHYAGLVGPFEYRLVTRTVRTVASPWVTPEGGHDVG